MTKDVMITIRGVQTDREQETETTEVVARGTYYQKNGGHYIFYEEASEDLPGPVKNRIRMAGTMLELTKKGAVNTQMVFEENRKTLSDYVLPFGRLQLGIATRTLEMKETDACISGLIRYTLEINDEYLRDCTLHIEVRPAELRGMFHVIT